MGRRSEDEEDEYERRRRRRRREEEEDRNRRRSRSRSRSPKKKKRRSRSRSRSQEEDRHRRRDNKKAAKKSSKKSKHKKRSRSRSSSSSSGGSDSSSELLRRLETERRDLRDRRRAEKERMKAAETPEEKRARRLLKKELKEVRRRERSGFGGFGAGAGGEGGGGEEDEYSRYTNDDNPFGDSNLTQTFRWGKKLQKEGLDKLDERDLEKLQRRRQEEQRQELEKVKLARQAREREREERQAMLEMEERARENDKFEQWRRQEDDFHLQQARLRSTIRIKDGRSKPIDLLAKYISPPAEGEGEEGDVVDALQMHEPYTYLNGLTTGDLEDLLADIRVYEGIDLDRNRDFWSDIVVIVEDELAKLRKMDAAKSQYELAAERRQGINKAVADDVQKVFEGKTADQLTQLQSNIERKLQSRADGLDVNYWESLLSQLKAHLARARLRDRHRENLHQKLALMKAELGGGGGGRSEEEESSAEVKDEGGSPRPGTSASGAAAASSAPAEEDEEDQPVPPGEEEEDVAARLRHHRAMAAAREALQEDPRAKDYDRGGYSPQYFMQDDLELGTHVVPEDEDEARRRADRDRVLRGGKVEGVVNAEEKALEREAKKGMGGDEASFSVETALEMTYEWSDKYRPRKPRYFNRVHTGFEWNKYNQTHYDIDNPPPKIVQGYKFNIFYPDLIDKKATPQYKLIPTADNPDFQILRISAGPPYEDIAFKIVRREWELGYKRGFKCQFHNNIFQLWFHFKRLRYRR